MSEEPASRKGLILSVNAGSSSLKISLYRLASSPNTATEPVELLLVSSISNITSPPAQFSFQLDAATKGQETKKEPIDSISDHTSAFKHFLDYLQRETGIDREQIVHVCHRVVHGGDYYEPIIINEESYEHIEKLSDLAPLHNGAALSVMKAAISALPKATSIAYFDTSFHRSMPHHIAYYAINPDIARKRGLKKYGFHGLSYAYILRVTSSFLKKNVNNINLIIMHLGSGASICAIQDGKSLDTSMGLTPLSGLPGATRSGQVDPSLIFHYTNRAGRITHNQSQAVNIHVTRAEDILNRQSGWKAITGTTDFGEIVKQKKAAETRAREEKRTDLVGDEERKWKMAFDMFVDRVCDFLGAYFLKLSGKVDALVFSGGIGEKSVELREAVMEKMKHIGFLMDEKKNVNVDQQEGVVIDIGKAKEEEDRRVLVVHTDEQLQMARECVMNKRFWADDDHT